MLGFVGKKINLFFKLNAAQVRTKYFRTKISEKNYPLVVFTLHVGVIIS